MIAGLLRYADSFKASSWSFVTYRLTEWNYQFKGLCWLCYVYVSTISQWPSCVITSDDQISPPSLVCKQNSSHLHSFCVGILFNRTALGIHLCKTSQLCILKTRLGGEIYSSDVNMYKGYSARRLVNGFLLGPVQSSFRPYLAIQSSTRDCFGVTW